MTVGIGINCKDGMIVACDSLATFGRGVPILRYTNKAYIIEHEKLENPVAVVGAGMTTFIHKFRDRAMRIGIDLAAERLGYKLDVLDFCEGVAEPIVSGLLKNYEIDRAKFFGAPISEYSLSLIVAGLERNGELRGYFVYADGVSEPLEGYGTIGSGAAYAELSLRFLLVEPEIDTKTAGRLAIYAIKGVELMDPNVGGNTNVLVLSQNQGNVQINEFPDEHRPEDPREMMEKVLGRIGKSIEELLEGGDG